MEQQERDSSHSTNDRQSCQSTVSERQSCTSAVSAVSEYTDSAEKGHDGTKRGSKAGAAKSRRSWSSKLKTRVSRCGSLETVDEIDEDDAIGGDSYFEQLLRSLAEEHEHEVSILRDALSEACEDAGLNMHDMLESRFSLSPRRSLLGPPPGSPQAAPPEYGSAVKSMRDDDSQQPWSPTAPMEVEASPPDMSTLPPMGDKAETWPPPKNLLGAAEARTVPNEPHAEQGEELPGFVQCEENMEFPLTTTAPLTTIGDTSTIASEDLNGVLPSNSMSMGGPHKRNLPRIAGLKTQGSCMKSGNTKSTTAARFQGGARFGTGGSVMFENSVAEDLVESQDEPTTGEAKAVVGNGIVPRPIWQVVPPAEGAEDEAMQVQRKKKTEQKKRSSSMRDESVGKDDAELVLANSFGPGSTDQPTPAWMDKFVSHPNSTLNLSFDLLSIVCICYDMVVIPLGVFGVEDTTASTVFRFFTTCFWTTDFLRHFFKGHYRQGDVVMEIKLVILKYLKTWFLMDCCLVCSDIAELVVGLTRDEEGGNIARLLRLMRNVRSVRLLRGMKTGEILKMIEDRINSEALGIFWNMTKLFILILVANHFGACSWYWLGGIYDDTVPSWRNTYLVGHALGHETLYEYTTSFHWSITQCTPASIEVQPENSTERIFAICCLVWGFVTVSTFISGLTSAVMQLRQLGAVKHKQFWLFRKYLNENQVPTRLAVRLNHYCTHAWDLRGRRIQDKHVEILKMLSPALRMEMKVAIFSPQLTHHAFFMLLKMSLPTTMRSLCSMSLSQCHLTSGDDLFMSGEEAHHMFFTGRGEVTYKEQKKAKMDGELVASADWVCEACLWTVWTYRGTLTAARDGVAVAVEANTFGTVLTLNAEARKEALSYSKNFINGINREPAWKLNDFYTSSLIEGLWFRLLKDFKVTRATNKGSTREKRLSPFNKARLQTILMWYRTVDCCRAMLRLQARGASQMRKSSQMCSHPSE